MIKSADFVTSFRMWPCPTLFMTVGDPNGPVFKALYVRKVGGGVKLASFP